jgi:integrase
MGKLTDLTIKNAKPGKHTDGHGLYLLVTVSGGKLWRYDFRFDGKRKTLAMGQYPTVTLLEARQRHLDAIKAIEQGSDPTLDRKREKAIAKVAAGNTFEQVAAAWLDKTRNQRQHSTNQRTVNWLERDVYPAIGRTPVSALTAADVLAVLRRMESRGLSDSVTRAKRVIARVLDFAVVEGMAASNPVTAISNRDNFTTAKTKHHAAIISPEAFGGLLRSIRGYTGHITTSNAINLLALVFCRPGELRQLRWEWVNLEQAIIELPGEIMKMRRPHLIPLSRQAIEILRQQQAVSGHLGLVFPGLRGQGKLLSENTFNAVLRACGYGPDVHVSHGFRASARTLLKERLKCSADVIELQLAHAKANPLGEAYDRSSLLDERILLMRMWSDYCDKLAHGGEVVQLHRGAA